MKGFLTRNWKDILRLIVSPVIAFIIGFKAHQIELKKSENEAHLSGYTAEHKKIENFERVIEINGEMIEQIKTDFDDRAVFLKHRIKEVEQINLRLDRVVRNQRKLIKEQEKVIEDQQKKLKKYRALYGNI
ncbi:hypothetical protein [Tenacibaculum sp. MAR_2009_124]|uniref:hypothetical protein n=1 Tax=Tenacibaculum sp. MAR_2009_124 TaxID=1250059 RepID=UPI000B829B6C|nr:hypothetical protein [Tenacibaculum sp. MAR_2009_124]